MELTKQLPAIKISKRKIKSLVHDGAKSAEAVNLVYVNDRQKGINRIAKGKGFIYVIDSRQVDDEDILSRIQSLAIPPAWEQVWICRLPNGHIQATGVDAKNRKQYRYHPLWNTLRSEVKFSHLHDFGNALCDIRKQVKADLALPGLPLQKVLAAVVSLMEYTGIRVGSNTYEKLYGSYGLTTLKDQHVKISGNEMKFSFTGKKGIYQNFSLKSKKLAGIVRQCRDIPGKELFQYYDENGRRNAIDSGMVNDYVKSACGKDFTAKDFRTWVGTLCALETFMTFECCNTVTETKKRVIEAIDTVAKRLGNTRTVCRKYYVHPVVIGHYTNKTIEKYIPLLSEYIEDSPLSPQEQILMKMLEKSGTAVIDV